MDYLPENRPAGSGPSSEELPVEDDPSSFFDRERWHDVETSDESTQETDYSTSSPLSSASVAVLLLVSVVAAGGGLSFAYYIHRAEHLAGQPISRLATDYRTIPQQWIGYTEEQAVWIRDVDHPGCFAASFQGDLIIGEESQPTLFRYSLNGVLLETFSLAAEPTAVAVAGNEDLFAGKLVVAFRNRLAVYSMDGKKQVDWPVFRENGNIRSLALTSDSIFAADSTERVVLRFNDKGKVVKVIGRPPSESTAPKSEDVNTFPGFVVFKSPISLTVSKKTGLLLVTNPGKHRIEAFTQDGHWEPSQSWGDASADLDGFAGCCNPVALASLSDGRTVTAEKSILRVKVYQTNRKLDWIVAGPSTLTNPPSNIPTPENFRTVAANSDRPILIAAISDDRIVVFDPVLRICRLFLPTPTERPR